MTPLQSNKKSSIFWVTPGYITLDMHGGVNPIMRLAQLGHVHQSRDQTRTHACTQQ